MVETRDPSRSSALGLLSEEDQNSPALPHGKMQSAEMCNLSSATMNPFRKKESKKYLRVCQRQTEQMQQAEQELWLHLSSLFLDIE